MEITGIKYIAPIFDNSGYAQAARGYALALHRLGIPITLSSVSFEKARPDLGAYGKILYSLDGRVIDYNIVITQLTPNLLSEKVEPNKFNINYSVWETTKIPSDWTTMINEYADIVMVGSEFNVGVYKNSGVTKPVFCVPHGIDLSEFEGVDPYRIKGVKPGAYKFYCINQFTERKNPMALIKSYWHAFDKGENVALILKTYRADYSDDEKNAVRTTIKRLRHGMPINNRPPIYLIPDMLSRSELLGLHKACDCFVSLDRGEGFGLGAFESGASGNPVIVTKFGGVTESAKPYNSYLVGYTLTPTCGMPWSNMWYTGDQLWAEPDCGMAISYMREVYNDQERAADKGKKLKEYIKDNLLWDKVGGKMLDAIRSL